LSKLLRIVEKGNEIVLTDRGRPVGKIVPFGREALPLAFRIKEMEYA
jgi:antitoxin (DNA-binding transcriptional repressor) of toxin-antitoxin stability system